MRTEQGRKKHRHGPSIFKAYQRFGHAILLAFRHFIKTSSKCETLKLLSMHPAKTTQKPQRTPTRIGKATATPFLKLCQAKVRHDSGSGQKISGRPRQLRCGEVAFFEAAARQRAVQARSALATLPILSVAVQYSALATLPDPSMARCQRLRCASKRLKTSGARWLRVPAASRRKDPGAKNLASPKSPVRRSNGGSSSVTRMLSCLISRWMICRA